MPSMCCMAWPKADRACAQACWKGHRQRQRYSSILQAAVKVQTCFRRFRCADMRTKLHMHTEYNWLSRLHNNVQGLKVQGVAGSWCNDL